MQIDPVLHSGSFPEWSVLAQGVPSAARRSTRAASHSTGALGANFVLFRTQWQAMPRVPQGNSST